MVIAPSLRRCGPVVLLLGLAWLGGCGECVFEVEVTAVVVDAEGEPMPGVEVRSCLGQGCAIAEDDDACVRSITDEEGRFTLEVPQCRPEPRECELRPLLLGREGCREESARIEPMAGEERVITFSCDP